jgi:hypothetical protein
MKAIKVVTSLIHYGLISKVSKGYRMRSVFSPRATEGGTLLLTGSSIIPSVREPDRGPQVINKNGRVSVELWRKRRRLVMHRALLLMVR